MFNPSILEYRTCQPSFPSLTPSISAPSINQSIASVVLEHTHTGSRLNCYSAEPKRGASFLSLGVRLFIRNCSKNFSPHY